MLGDVLLCLISLSVGLGFLSISLLALGVSICCLLSSFSVLLGGIGGLGVCLGSLGVGLGILGSSISCGGCVGLGRIGGLGGSVRGRCGGWVISYGELVEAVEADARGGGHKGYDEGRREG